MNENQSQNTEGVWKEISKVVVPDYARIHDPRQVESLAKDMAIQGQLQNVVVSEEGDHFEMIAGFGRLQAAQKLNWEKIRVDIKTGLTKTQKLMMTAAENTEREEANPFYTGKLYKMIADAEGLDGIGLADKLGKERTLVGKYLALANLPEEVQQAAIQQQISLSHGLLIGKLPTTEDQLKMVQDCPKKGLSVKALRHHVRRLTQPQKKVAPQATFTFKLAPEGIVIRAPLFKFSQSTVEDYLSQFKASLQSFMAQKGVTPTVPTLKLFHNPTPPPHKRQSQPKPVCPLPSDVWGEGAAHAPQLYHWDLKDRLPALLQGVY